MYKNMHPSIRSLTENNCQMSHFFFFFLSKSSTALGYCPLSQLVGFKKKNYSLNVLVLVVVTRHRDLSWLGSVNVNGRNAGHERM